VLGVVGRAFGLCVSCDNVIAVAGKKKSAAAAAAGSTLRTDAVTSTVQQVGQSLRLIDYVDILMSHSTHTVAHIEHIQSRCVYA